MLNRLRRLLARPAVREFLTFLGGSAVGLTVDLAGFALLVAVGLPPWAANLVSAFASITAVYLMVTRFTFAVRTRASTYALFVAWYSTSIVVFSILIQLAVSSTGWCPFGWKLASVPVSFLANYLFSRFLFVPRQKRDADEASGDDQPT